MKVVKVIIFVFTGRCVSFKQANIVSCHNVYESKGRPKECTREEGQERKERIPRKEQRRKDAREGRDYLFLVDYTESSFR